MACWAPTGSSRAGGGSEEQFALDELYEMEGVDDVHDITALADPQAEKQSAMGVSVWVVDWV